MKIKLQFVITGLSANGAEKMLLKLVSRMDRSQFSTKVTSLTSPLNTSSSLREEFLSAGIPVTHLDINKSLSIPQGVLRLVGQLKSDRPHIVQTWMYHADLIGGLSSKIAGRMPVLWNIRHSDLDKKVDKTTTILAVKVCARLSSTLPTHIICCSETAKGLHEKLGYDPSKIIVIPNGFDLTSFSPNKSQRQKLRNELGVSDDKIIVGLVGRYHPQKDHKNFIKAAARLSQVIKGVEFLLCGKDVNWQNDELTGLIDSFGMRGAFHLLGYRNDIHAVTASFDIANISSACGEGFPNVIGEAMACEIPCVVTDVGDSSMIVGATGKVVPQKDPEALCNAWAGLIKCGVAERQRLGFLARQRIHDHFSIDKIVDQYQELYLRTLQ